MENLLETLGVERLTEKTIRDLKHRKELRKATKRNLQWYKEDAYRRTTGRKLYECVKGI